MFGNALLKAAGFASMISSAVALGGCVPRIGREMLSDTSFELGDYSWNFSHNTYQQENLPSFPSHTGNRSRLIKARATKARGEGAVTNYTEPYVSNLSNSVSGRQYLIKGYYKVLSHSKGEYCPDYDDLPLTSCRLRFSYGYVDRLEIAPQQNIATIHLNPTSDYVEVSAFYTPFYGGDYLHIMVECEANPGCSEATVLLDDITWTDAGHVCWTPTGCYVDSVPGGLLPHHGRLHNFPHTTTIESCQEACGNDGHIYAGLENGRECYCGDTLVGGTLAPASECNKPCTGNGDQLCGGQNRVEVYQKP